MIGQQVQRPPPEESNRTNLWTDFQREVNALAKSGYILFVFVSSFFVLGAHKQYYMKRGKKASRLHLKDTKLFMPLVGKGKVVTFSSVQTARITNTPFSFFFFIIPRRQS